MVEVIKSATFDAWLHGLRDRTARVRVLARIDRLAHGNPGDLKPVGSGVSEMRIDHGPGYRVYFIQKGDVLIRPPVWRRQELPDPRHQGRPHAGG